MSHITTTSRERLTTAVELKKHMSYIYLSHVTYINASRHKYKWVTSQIYRENTFPQQHHQWKTWFTSHIKLSDIIHIFGPCCIDIRVMSHIWTSCATNASIANIHQWALPYICVSMFTHIIESRRTNMWVMSHTWMSHVTRAYSQQHH